jgi:N-glycosylase/DNA lyase
MECDLFTIRKRLAEVEPRLAPMLKAFPGLRTLRPASPTETLFSFLCTANNHMSRIVQMARYLASKGLEIEPGHYVFPSVEQLAEISEVDLRANGFGYRGATIPAVAEAVIERGDGWLKELASVDYPSARAELRLLPGVGPKLADCVCLFGLHFEHAVPIDTHVWKTVTEWYAPELRGVALTPSRYDQVANLFRSRFGELSGWAQQYVFYNRYISYRTRAGRPV